MKQCEAAWSWMVERASSGQHIRIRLKLEFPVKKVDGELGCHHLRGSGSWCRSFCPTWQIWLHPLAWTCTWRQLINHAQHNNWPVEPVRNLLYIDGLLAVLEQVQEPLHQLLPGGRVGAAHSWGQMLTGIFLTANADRRAVSFTLAE